MRNTPAARLELILLAGALLAAFCGLFLTFQGKQAATPLPVQTLNINTATAGQLAQALSVPKPAAQALVNARQARPYASVSQLLHQKALKGQEAASVGDRLIAREPVQVAHSFWGGAAVFLIAFLLTRTLLRKALPQADPFLLPLVSLLCGLGLMLVYTVKDPYRDTFAFTGQVWGVTLYGMLALLLPALRPFQRLPLRRYQYAYAGAAILLMSLLAIFGNGPGGIHIRLFGAEPVEGIKVLLIFFVASYLSERRGLQEKTRALPTVRDIAPLAAVYAFALLLFVLVKDLGPAVLLFGAFLTLVYLNTQRWIYPIAGTILLLGAGWIGYVRHFGFFATRVAMWLNPWDNADPRGAQLAQGLWGMATGGLTGSGLGLGHPEVMPRAGSDLIFATLGEELGLFGTLTVLALYALLVARGFRIAQRAGTEFDRLLAAGLTTLLAYQTLIIIGGVTGFVPLTGMTLPFVSFGASSLVADFFSVGMLLAISGKALPDAARDRPTPEWTRAARQVVTGWAALLLLGIGVGRLIWVQGVQDDQIATRPLRSPDADGVRRPHLNPRLLGFASSIPRGRILDRTGKVLAQDAPDGQPGTTFLTPDGRARLYAGGPACAPLLLAVEADSDASAFGQNAALRGFPNYASLLPAYRSRWRPWFHPPHGEDITLTIDADLQQTAYEALARQAGRLRDRKTGQPKRKGAAVALNAQTGEILACATAPSFDLDTMTPEAWDALHRGEDPDLPLMNRAVTGLYPPGSAFKIVTAAAGLRAGRASFLTECDHVGPVRWRFEGPRSRRVTDENGMPPHGRTDMADALRVSCNVYFARLAAALGPDALDQTARQGFDLHHMAPRKQIGEALADTGYGQGAALVTPLEMGRVAQAVANTGRLVPASLIHGSALGTAGTPLTAPQAIELQRMLHGVTVNGTAQGVFDGLRVSVAGKTGSAENGQGDRLTHSWFVGFAPAENPTLAFACVIENGGYGRSAAAPVCREIVRKAL